MDALTGTNKVSCGINRKTPCKDLSEGVKRTKKSGMVHVIGNHHLQHNVVLKKSIQIKADNIRQGRITSNGSVDFAFILQCEKKLKVKLKGLHFDSIGVFDVQCNNNPDIEIDNITVMNISGNTPTIRFKSGSLIIHN